MNGAGHPAPSARTDRQQWAESRRSWPATGLARLFLLRRHLGARLARLRQADRDRLLAAGHRLAGLAALQFAALLLMHRLAHFVLGLLAVSGHVISNIRVPT